MQIQSCVMWNCLSGLGEDSYMKCGSVLQGPVEDSYIQNANTVRSNVELSPKALGRTVVGNMKCSRSVAILALILFLADLRLLIYPPIPLSLLSDE